MSYCICCTLYVHVHVHVYTPSGVSVRTKMDAQLYMYSRICHSHCNYSTCTYAPSNVHLAMHSTFMCSAYMHIDIHMATDHQLPDNKVNNGHPCTASFNDTSPTQPVRLHIKSLLSLHCACFPATLWLESTCTCHCITVLFIVLPICNMYTYSR